MNHYFKKNVSVFFFLFCIIFGCILPAAEPNSGFVPPPGRTGRHLNSTEIADYENKKALEAYNERNAEIDSWIEDDAIQDYNNAALLYYQALLLQPDHNQLIINKFYKVYGGAEPDTQIRILLGKWLPSMKVSEIASRIPQCTWEIWPGKIQPELETNQVSVMKSFRQYNYIIIADAITLASDGHYRAALERCMTLRRIARHLSYDSYLFMVSTECDSMALKTICRIIGDMPPDAEVLTWIKGRLAAFQGAPPLLEGILKKDLKEKTDMVQSYSIPRLRGMLLKRAADETARQRIRNLTDDQIRNQALETVQGFFDSIFTILHSDKSAEQKYAEIQQITSPDMISHKDFSEPLMIMIIYDQLGAEAATLIAGTDSKMTEEKKLDEIQKIIDKSEEPNTLELFEKYSNAIGEEIDFSFLVNSEMTDEQKLVEMRKAINKLNDAFAIETSTFGLPLHTVSWYFKTYIGGAVVNSTRAAVELYLIMAETGQLPDELPDDLPKDPYTGRNFLYEITDDGFVLGCRSDIFNGGKYRFMFHIPKKDN